MGSGKAREFIDIFSYLCKILKIEAELEFVDNPWSFYQNHTEADIASTKEILGYEPRFDLESGIDIYIEEIKEIFQKKIANVSAQK